MQAGQCLLPCQHLLIERIMLLDRYSKSVVYEDNPALIRKLTSSSWTWQWLILGMFPNSGLVKVALELISSMGCP
jgi:uncharacterized phosphosugar-binding protein